MGQRWNNLLFMHWPVAVNAIRALVPPSLTIDMYEGDAWISITPFYLSHLHARGLPPIPFTSRFPELNVRTYVTAGGKGGVYFFSLDAGNVAAVLGARTLYHLPYFNASMTIHLLVPDARFDYRSHRTDNRAAAAEFHAQYRAIGEEFRSVPGSIDHWLSERYCLYAADSSARLYRADIHHKPWPLQPAEVEIRQNTMAAAAGVALPERPARLAFARRLDVVVWAPRRIG